MQHSIWDLILENRKRTIVEKCKIRIVLSLIAKLAFLLGQKYHSNVNIRGNWVRRM